ncbi:MAG TPA: hypothetical protein VNA25_26115 [Phycisphaerae bacterium]|nr:hypothetical protein [Phycisphaerae bacterium]
MAPTWLCADMLWRPADWVQIVNRPQTAEELAALRRCVQRGRPYGSEPWVRRLAAEWDQK